MQIIKKKLLKSTVAKVMAAAMVVSMIPTISIPVSVSAKEIESTDTSTGKTEGSDNAQIEGGTNNNSEQQTSDKMPDIEDGIIKLENDICLNNYWSVKKDTILDLAGHKIEFNGNKGILVYGHKLTIRDDTEKGIITLTSAEYSSSPIIYVNKDNNNKPGVLVFEGGTIKNLYGYGIVSYDNSCIIINGGNIESNLSSLSGQGLYPNSYFYILSGKLYTESGPCIYIPVPGELLIGASAVETTKNESIKNDITTPKNDTLELSGGISLRMGTVKITDGIITSTNNKNSESNDNELITSQFYEHSKEQNVHFPDALYVLAGTYGDGEGLKQNELNLEISGTSKFNCSQEKGSAIAIYDFGKYKQTINININGGTFNKTPNTTTTASADIDNRTAFDVFKSSTWNVENLESSLDGNQVKISGGEFSSLDTSKVKEFLDNSCCIDTATDGKSTVGTHDIKHEENYKAAVKGTLGNIAYKYCDNCRKWLNAADTPEKVNEKTNHDYELYCISVPNKPAHTTVTFKNNVDGEKNSNHAETGSYGKLLNTETLTITPDDGYTFSKAPTVTPSENAPITVTNPVLSNDGKSYTYTITANEGTLDDVDLTITADATLANYNVSFDRSKLPVADADVYFINGTTKVTDNPYKVDKDVKELYIVIEPKAGKVFDTAPVITAVPASAIVNDVVIENGVYKYKVILGGDNADIKLTVGGAAKDAQYKITLPSNVSTSIPHASAELDFAEAAYNGSVKLTITPELGYTISNPSVKVADEKVCKLSEAVSEANGTFVYTISNITGNVAITSITATVAEPELVELKNTVQDNVNEASLSDTFANGNTKEEKAAQRQNYNYILSAAKEAISNITQDSDLVTFDGDYSPEEKAALIKELKDAVENNSSKIALSLEVKNTEPVNNEISETRREVENKISGNNATIGAKFYPLDISLFARVIKNDETQNNAKIKLTDTKQGKISIRMKKPNDIPNKSDSVTRKFYIVHFHKDANGTVRREIIDVTENEDGTLSFSSNAFSTYVLCYTDTIVNNNNSSTISGGGTPVVYPNGSTGGSGGGSGSQSTSTPTPSASTAPVASAAPSITPSVAPSTAPSTIPSAAPSTTPNTPSTPDTEPTAKPVSTVKVGQKVTDASVNYKVTSVSGSRTLTVTGAKSVKNVVIPASVKIAGKTYKVTAIANNAYKGNKNLTKITIGSNISKIGKNAFSGCTNLKKITIKTTKLTASKIGKNAFKGINKKAVIKVPKSKVKLYKKIIKARGAAKSVQVK